MEGSVYRKPRKLSLLLLFIDETLDARHIRLFRLFKMHQKLHVTKHIMILLLMMLKPIFLSIQHIPLNATNKTKTILILLKRLFLLSHICKFINNDSTNNLTDNKLNDKKVNEVHDYVSEGRVNKGINVAFCR